MVIFFLNIRTRDCPRKYFTKLRTSLGGCVPAPTSAITVDQLSVCLKRACFTSVNQGMCRLAA